MTIILTLALSLSAITMSVKCDARKVTATPATGPIQVSDDNIAAGWIDVYTLDHSGTGAPLSVTRDYYDNAGRALREDRYYNLDGTAYTFTSSFGVINTNYYETTDSYNSDGLPESTTDALGTTATTIYDALGRPIQTWLGNGTVSSMIESEEYDGGGVGDGNVTRDVQIPGLDSLGGKVPNRVTTNYYDWRDRLVATDNTVRLTYNTLDNLGEVTKQDVYDTGRAGFPAFTGPTGFLNGNASPPSSTSARRAETTSVYDDDGEVITTNQVSVDQTSGATGASLTGQSRYDADGNVIATSSPTGLWTKTTYDGAGRPIAVYYTDNAGTNPANETGDHVFSQQEITYDKDGNATLTVTRDRQPTDTGTGPLGSTARVASVQNVYNAAGQLTETDNFGTNPVTTDRSGALISYQGYNAGTGQLDYTVDAAGTWTHYDRDMLGRVKTEKDNWNGSDSTSTATMNKATIFTYNGDDEIKTSQIFNVLPANVRTGDARIEPQLTTYTYGGTDSLDQSKLTAVAYPDGTSQSYVYDRLGDIVKKTQQDTTVHTYGYDALGREIVDHVNYFAAGVDQSLQALTTSYDVLDRPVLMTSKGQAPAPNNPGQTYYGTVNQVENVYNSFGQLDKQYQADGGNISGTNSNTLAVQYIYDSANPSRLTRLVYPDGRVEWYTYSGLDANISRVTSVNDDSSGAAGTQIESYSYTGLNTVTGKTRAQEGVTEAITIDPYGHVGMAQWATGSAVTESFWYTYDGVGNVSSMYNSVDDYASEAYGYDALHRLNYFVRGLSSAGHTGGVTWQYDSTGNKFDGVDGSGATVAGKYGTGYSGNNHKDSTTTGSNSTGNAKTVALPEGNATLTYDAWGRVVVATSDIIEVTRITHAYAYDALGREISDSTKTTEYDYPKTGNDGKVSQDEISSTTVPHRLLYDGQNVIENRSAGSVTAQNVWSAAGPNLLILRDRHTSPTATGDSRIPQVDGSPLDERIYAQDNGQGSTTSITDIAGGVLERYLFDEDGQPTAIQGDWTAWSDNNDSHYNWVYFWHGGQYTRFAADDSSGLASGLYSFNAGGSWYDSYHGVSIQPDFSGYGKPARTPYDPNAGETGIWSVVNAQAVVNTIRIGSWLIPGIGPIVGLAVNYAANAADRGMDGQTFGQVSVGGWSDTIGLTDIVGAFTNKDPFTQKSMNWSTGGQWFHGIAGALQFLPIVGQIAKSFAPVIRAGMSAGGSAMRSSGSALALAMSGESRLANAVAAAGSGLGRIPMGVGTIGNTLYSIGSKINAEEFAESGYGRNGEQSDYRIGIKQKFEIHHIATNKSDTYTPLFEKLFQDARMTLDDPLNTIPVLGHQGPHGDAYHWIILNELQQAVQNILPNTPQFRFALQNKLKELAATISTRGSDLNLMVRFVG